MVPPNATFDMRIPTSPEQEGYIAKCNFMWTPLSPLWNPTSIYTWAKTLEILAKVNFVQVFPPHIIQKAAYHGLAVIYGQENLRLYKNITMCVQSRDPGKAFVELLRASKDPKIRAAIYEAYKDTEYGWGPQTYLAEAGSRKCLNSLPFQNQANKIADGICKNGIDTTLPMARVVGTASAALKDLDCKIAAYDSRDDHFALQQLGEEILP